MIVKLFLLPIPTTEGGDYRKNAMSEMFSSVALQSLSHATMSLLLDCPVAAASARLSLNLLSRARASV